MMDRAWADRYAREWIDHWHARDLDALLAHYTPDVVFHSPRIADVLGGSKATVTGIEELRHYWSSALSKMKTLHFDLQSVLLGSDAITILYRNQRGQDVAETLLFDGNLKVVEAIVTYS